MLLYDVILLGKDVILNDMIFLHAIVNNKRYFGCLPLPSMPVENESVKLIGGGHTQLQIPKMEVQKPMQAVFM